MDLNVGRLSANLPCRDGGRPHRADPNPNVLSSRKHKDLLFCFHCEASVISVKLCTDPSGLPMKPNDAAED